MTDKQFEDSFTAAGGWFLLTQFNEIYTWNGDKSSLVDSMFLKGFDKNRAGTNTRVSSVLRIIRENRFIEALEKCRDSARINKEHPDAERLVKELLSKLKEQA